MADSFHSLNYHFIWSTKERVPWISQDIETRVWEYLSGIAFKKRMTPLAIGGCDDHIHALVRLPPNMDVSKAIQLLKGSSSKWIHEIFPKLRGFEWQDGYGAFTVAKSGIPAAFKYIQNQRRHHAKKTFKDEFRAFLVKHEIEFDEKYLWGGMGRRKGEWPVRVSLCDTNIIATIPGLERPGYETVVAPRLCCHRLPEREVRPLPTP